MTNQHTSRKIRKSSANRMIDGICGGVAEYLRLDPVFVRVGCVLLALAGGVGLVLYLAAIVIMPPPDPSTPSTNASNGSGTNGYLITGVLFVVTGCLWFLKVAGFFSLHSLAWLSWKAVLPIVLIIVGVALLFKRSKPPVVDSDLRDVSPGLQGPGAPGIRRFYRSRSERKCFGVCSGLGTYFSVDPVIVRILFVASAFVSFGFVLIAYLLLSILVSEEPITLAV